MFTDTDSLVYDNESEDVYENKNLVDFNDYPKRSKFFDPVNKKLIFITKDEFKEKTICGFVRLKSKIYSLLFFCLFMSKQKVLTKLLLKT